MAEAANNFTENKRGEARRRTLKSAKVVFGDYRYVIDCTMRDVSPTGARLKVGAAVSEVPTEFHLFDLSDRSIRRASVVWREGKEIGVRFDSEPVPVHDASDPRLARFRYM